MNITKKLLPLSMVASILIFTACGGDSTSDGGTPPSQTEIKTVDQAKSNFQALSVSNSFDGLGNALDNDNQKTTFNKTTTHQCTSGSLSITEEGSTFSFVADKCRIANYYIDGSISEVELSDGSTKMSMSNLTMKDGEIEMTSTQLLFVENENDHWLTMDGDMKIVSKCFSGTYNLETVEKIYEAQDGSDNAESGILKLNGVTYTFDNPHVTIKTATEEETILQSELEKQMSNTTTCSE